MSRAMPCRSVASSASWASPAVRLSRSARSAAAPAVRPGSARPPPGGAAHRRTAARSRRPARPAPRAGPARRQGGEDAAKRPHHPVHQMLGRPGQGGDLPVGLPAVDEVAAERLQGGLIEGVEQVGDLSGQRIGDRQRLCLDVGGAPHIGRLDRSGRLEGGVDRSGRPVGLQQGDELAEVGVAPVAPGAFALFDDELDRGLGRGQVGDRGQLRPLEHLGGRLGVGRPDEHPVLAVALDEPLQAVLDAAVQVTDGLVVLGDGHQLIAVGQRLGLADGGEALGVGQVHPFGAFQVDEVPQGSFLEPDQGDLHPGRIPARQDGEVRPVQVWGGPDGGEQVGGQRQVQHLLLDDVDEHLLPGGHRGQLLVAQRRLERQSRLLASGGLTPMLPRRLSGSSRPLASADGPTTQSQPHERRSSPCPARACGRCPGPPREARLQDPRPGSSLVMGLA